MDSPLDNFAGSLANALQPDNQYTEFANYVVLLHRRYTECREYIDYMFSKPQDETDVAKIVKYRELTEEKRWHECAKQLTNTIQYQIEFVKNLPLFRNLGQDDQITSIKSCMFEMAVARLSRLIDLEKDLVLYVDVVMPIKDCVRVGDPRDVALVEEIFDAAKKIARLNLTDTELGLFACLLVTLPDYHDTLDDKQFVVSMYEHALGGLKQETDMNHTTPEGDDSVLEQLLAMTTTLRNLSKKHIEALRRFEAAYPDLTKFPSCLYKYIYCDLPDDYCPK